jgi:hypothetical protein
MVEANPGPPTDGFLQALADVGMVAAGDPAVGAPGIAGHAAGLLPYMEDEAEIAALQDLIDAAKAIQGTVAGYLAPIGA